MKHKSQITEEELAATSPKNMGDVMMQQCKPGETSDMTKELVEALERLVHLHMCEQEGIVSGQPTRNEWLEAVDNASEVLSKYKNQKEGI
jgi:hypothetical protein